MNHSVNSADRSSKRIKRAWLITWERASHRPTARKRFVALISSRFSGATVKSILKQYYVSDYLSLPEQLSYITSKRCLYEVQTNDHFNFGGTAKSGGVAHFCPFFGIDDYWRQSLAVGAHGLRYRILDRREQPRTLEMERTRKYGMAWR